MEGHLRFSIVHVGGKLVYKTGCAAYFSSNMATEPAAQYGDEDSNDQGVTSQAHDSMVTVRLSEPPPFLTVNTASDLHKVVQQQQVVAIVEEDTKDGTVEQQEDSPRITMMDPNGEILSPSGSESASENGGSRRGSDSSDAVSEGGVNWEELEKTEEQEPRDQGSDDVRCGELLDLQRLC